MKKEINMIIIHGFLGAGKTTFLRNMMDEFKKKRLGIIINDFGDANIDKHLVPNSSNAIKEIHSGSIFCSCKEEEFIKKVRELIQSNIELLLVESSGFSNPTTLGKITKYIAKQNDLALNSINITICDAKSIYKIIETLEISKKQIEMADLILLNKIDIATNKEKQMSLEKIKSINKKSLIIECVYNQFDYKEIFRIRSHDKNTASYQIIDISLYHKQIVFNHQQELITLKDLFNDLKQYVFRIKGFVELKNNKTIYIELDGHQINYHEVSEEKDCKLVILYSNKVVGFDSIKEIINKHLKYGEYNII